MSQTREQVLQSIRDRPNLHQHSYDRLVSCCTLDGAVDLSLMEAHEAVISGPNRRCDVVRGPCGCGAWH